VVRQCFAGAPISERRQGVWTIKRRGGVMAGPIGRRQNAGGATTSFLISALPPGATQKRLALAIALVLLVVFVGALPFRDVPLRRQDAFVPIANTIVFLSTVLTAALLYAQFSVTRRRALLALASGYLFTGLVFIPHALTFPGAFSTTGLLGAHLQTNAWLYIIQHLGLLMGAIAYTSLDRWGGNVPAAAGRTASAIVASTTAVVAVAVGVTWLAVSQVHILPAIMADSTHTTATWRDFRGPLMIGLGLTSIIVFRKPRTSMVDLWLHVALWSWVLETIGMAVVQGRFTVVFYVSRSMGILSSSFVLFVLLSESILVHARLVLSMMARDQEREGQRTAMEVLIGSLAHELRQPLAAIKANASAGARTIPSTPNAVDEIRATFEDIGGSVDRATEIVESVRTMFAASQRDRGWINANDLVRDALGMMRPELEAHSVAVSVHLPSGLPAIHGHRGQLMQVLVNGMTNALESLTDVSDRTRQLHIRTVRRKPAGVSIVIEDSGIGLDPRQQDRLFEPFYSTKPRGMGLGLLICQSIVEAHGGTLSLVPRSEHGAIFQVDIADAGVEGEGAREPSPAPLSPYRPSLAPQDQRAG
jgi:signal transduction histidine kinase